MNCKPGDLAILFKALLPENIGKIVEVIKPIGDDCGLGFRWLVKPSGSFRTMSVVDFKTIFANSESVGIPDSWLRPVSGLPVTDDIDTEIPA